jgi:hypothetical protein
MDSMKLPYTRRKTPAEKAAEKARPTLISKLKKLTPSNIMLQIIANKIRPFVANYVTTLTGLGLIFGGLATGAKDLAALATGDPLDMETLKLAGTQIVGGFGLLFARQQGK